jgi:thiol-disulfide isomerase/thioredoxin
MTSTRAQAEVGQLAPSKPLLLDRIEAGAAAGLIWREYQLSCRGAIFWAVTVIGVLLALWRASTEGATGALAAYHVWKMSVAGLAVLAVLIAGAAAARDKREGTAELVFAKTMGSSGYLVVARFLGVWLSLMTVVAVMLAAAATRQVVGGTPWHLGAYANAFARAVAPMALATALGFSLTALLANSLAGAVGALYWIAIPLVRAHVPSAADMTLTQHWPVGALLTLGLISLTTALYARSLRGYGQARSGMGWAAAILLAAGLAAAVSIAFDGEDTLSHRDEVLSAIAAQRVKGSDRAPGFWSQDGRHRIVAMSGLDGRPVALAFWGPSDPQSARVIALLAEAAEKFGDKGLACVAVCLDGDSATVGPFAKEAGPHVTVVWDRGQHYGDGEPWSDSPLGLAYEVKSVPTIVLLDKKRRLVKRIESHAVQSMDLELARLVGRE